MTKTICCYSKSTNQFVVLIKRLDLELNTYICTYVSQTAMFSIFLMKTLTLFFFFQFI